MRLFVLLGLVFLAAALSAAPYGEKAIRTVIEYHDGSEFDADNNGITAIGSVIDFTVKNTEFSWEANESNLCTRWHVIPEEEPYSTTTCYGSALCCSLVELYPSSDNWADAFYLYPDLYQSGPRNSVGAQVIYADYTLDYDSNVDVAYSDFSYLPAVFTEAAGLTMLSAQEGVEASIAHPSNASPLSSGEGIYLIATANASATAVYSLDNSTNKPMEARTAGTGTNLSALLGGSLPFNVLSNGNHLAKVYIAMASGNITLEHPFVVSDTTPPSIKLANLSNTTFVISAGERSNLSYELNGAFYNASLNDSNAALLTLNVTNGINQLRVYARDMHGNKNEVNYTLNVTVESCTDGIKNYHDGQQETGVDCGGSCSACVELSISTDKSSYLVNEFAYIQVRARSDVTHNIRITGPSYYSQLTYNGSTYYIINPPNPGNYTANVTLKYRNLPAESAITYFLVNSTAETNPLTATLNANATTASVGDAISFSASATGNESALQYKWELNGDLVIDSTSQSVNYSYQSPGTFTASLNVRDSRWNQTATKIITVLPYYNITIRVRDKTTGMDIPATIILENQEKTSPYETQLKSGRYKLAANYSGYMNYSSYLDVERNETAVIHIATNTEPAVTLVSPADNETLNSKETGFVFEVSRVPVTCTIYIRGSEGLTEAGRATINDTRHTFNPALENGSHEWKVGCTDAAGNRGESETRRFTLTELSKESAKTVSEISKVLDAVNAAVSSVDSLPKQEREAANSMNYRKLLEDARFELQRANRDIFNMPWRRFNETEEEAFRNEVILRVNKVKENLITNISVTRTSEFVSYPKDATVEEVARDYIKPATYTSDEIRNYVSKNTKLQAEVSVTTKYTTLKLTKYSGEVVSGTLTERRLTLNNASGIAVLEVIPKSLAESASEIEVFAKFKVIKDDPVIEVEPVDSAYSFLIRKSLTPMEIQSAETVFIYKDVEPLPRKASGLTGFAVLNLERASSPKAIVTEIIVLLLIAGLYFGYSRGGFGESGNAREIRALMRKAGSLSEHNYAESEELYRRLSELFKALKKKEKARAYPHLAELGNKIRSDNALNKIREAQVLCDHRQTETARKIYAEVSSIYKSLPSNHKNRLFTDCRELHKKLVK